MGEMALVDTTCHVRCRRTAYAVADGVDQPVARRGRTGDGRAAGSPAIRIVTLGLYCVAYGLGVGASRLFR